jgi:hypothetical protein
MKKEANVLKINKNFNEQIVNEEILKNPGKYEEGDLVEFTTESGHRMNGVYILKKSGKKLKLSKLMEMGELYVPDTFSLGPEKLPGYWDYAPFKYASWYHTPNPEPVAAKYWNKINASNIQSLDGKKQLVNIGWTTLVFDMPKSVLLKLIRTAKKDKLKALYFVNSEEVENNIVRTSQQGIRLSGEEPKNAIYFDSFLTPYFYDLPEWKQQQQKKQQQKKKQEANKKQEAKKQTVPKKKTEAKKIRPSPSQSATSFQVGQKKKGNDGNMYQVKENKNGVKRWTKVKQ